MKKYAGIEEVFCKLIDRLTRERADNEEIANIIYLGICGGTGSPIDTKKIVDYLKKYVDSDSYINEEG